MSRKHIPPAEEKNEYKDILFKVTRIIERLGKVKYRTVEIDITSIVTRVENVMGQIRSKVKENEYKEGIKEGLLILDELEFYWGILEEKGFKVKKKGKEEYVHDYKKECQEIYEEIMKHLGKEPKKEENLKPNERYMEIREMRKQFYTNIGEEGLLCNQEKLLKERRKELKKLIKEMKNDEKEPEIIKLKEALKNV